MTVRKENNITVLGLSLVASTTRFDWQMMLKFGSNLEFENLGMPTNISVI